MITQKYIPYQNIPDAPGKSVEEIRALGQRLFPFSPYSFQLAMCVYDWTTASFTRMVLLKIFQYTGIAQTPFPIDKHSIAQAIYASNWSTYTIENADFMSSFMMKPSPSLDDVKAQLENVASDLQKFSEIENRVLSAAMQALPRTSLFLHLQLFSGQMDLYELGLDHFGIEFLECPLNKGPTNQSLVIAFTSAMEDYVSTGKAITTKMVWSFTDTLDDAMHYSNGIVLVANHPRDSFVWETAAYITTLSDDPAKTEYTFMPGCQFRVQSVDTAQVQDKQIVVIVLQPIHQPNVSKEKTLTRPDIPAEVKEKIPAQLGGKEIVRLVNESVVTLGSHIKSTSANTMSLKKAFTPATSVLSGSPPISDLLQASA